MGGWKGSGEERDNKAGGDVNSQIGSFSCFPQPATLDGWLRQRPERIGETRAPPESWGNGGEGGGWSPGWGLRGGSSLRAAGKGMAPGNRQLPGKPKENCTNCLQGSPVCNLWAGETAPEVGEGEGLGPLWMTERGERPSPVGLGMGRKGSGQRTIAPNCPSFCPPLFPFAVTPSFIFPIFTFCSSSLPSLCLFFHCFFPPSSPPLLVTSAGCAGVCIAEMSSMNTD